MLELPGISCRPAPADLPGQKGRRIGKASCSTADERGLENRLGVLGLVLNCVVLSTTVYLDAAVRQFKAQGYPVREWARNDRVPFAVLRRTFLL